MWLVDEVLEGALEEGLGGIFSGQISEAFFSTD